MRSYLFGKYRFLFLAILVFLVLILACFVVCRPFSPSVTGFSKVQLPQSTQEELPKFIPQFDNPSSYVTLQGSLFSQATTTLYLRKTWSVLGPRSIHGRYSEEGTWNEGRIDGLLSVDGRGRLLLDFYDSASLNHASATATWSDGGQVLRGEFKEDAATSSRLFALQAVPELPGSVPLSFHRVRRLWEDSVEADWCEYEAEYVETDDPEMDRLIQKAILGDGRKTFVGEAENYLNGCKHQTLTQFSPEPPRQARKIQVEIGLNQNGLLSLFFRQSDWEGGVHESFLGKAITIDLKTKQRLFLQDFVQANRLQDFLVHEKWLTLDRLFSVIGHGQTRESFEASGEARGLRSFIDAAVPLTEAEQLKRFGTWDRFYLTQNGIVSFYNSYEVGMWSNTPHILVPFWQWTSLARRDSPASRLPWFQKVPELRN